MISNISKLKKFENDDIIVVKIIMYLENIDNIIFDLNNLEIIIRSLNEFKENIFKSDISQRRKTKILSILNSIILLYNDKLMDQIFKNIWYYS